MESENVFVKSIYILVQKINFRAIRIIKIKIGIKIENYRRIQRLAIINTVKKDFINYIEKYISNPKIILELGSRDGIQSIEFTKIYPNAKIYAFECYKPNYKLCIRNTAHFKNIKVIKKAVFNENKKLEFYPDSINWGAGSLFLFNRKLNENKKLKQSKITVDAIRIDSWAKEEKIKKIDLCWIDLQGADYEALESMGDMIYDIDAMFIELEIKELYKNQKLYDVVVNFMKDKGFSLIYFHKSIEDLYGNGIFLNNKFIK